MSVAASYIAAISVDGSSAVTVHVEPDALAPFAIASAAMSSLFHIY